MDDSEQGSLRRVIGFDEAKQVYSSIGGGNTRNIQKEFSTTARNLSCGQLLTDQTLTELPDYVKALPYTLFFFNVTGPSDINQMRTILGLNEQQMLEIYGLKIGECVVKSGGWPTPFKIKIDQMPITAPIRNERLQQIMSERIQQIGYRPFIKGSNGICLPIAPVPETIPVSNLQQKNTINQPQTTIDRMIKMLDYIKDHPGENVSSVYRNIGLNNQACNKIKGILSQNNFITIQPEKTGEAKRPKMKLYITDDGVNWLDENK
jgi:hypothetical protein